MMGNIPVVEKRSLPNEASAYTEDAIRLLSALDAQKDMTVRIRLIENELLARHRTSQANVARCIGDLGLSNLIGDWQPGRAQELLRQLMEMAKAGMVDDRACARPSSEPKGVN